jgi:hypothetical protein
MTPLHGRTAPSLLRYAPAFVLLAIAIADAGRVADTDLWGHIAFGRLFLRAGPVSHDPFNYSVPGHAWAVHEWMAELMMARIYDSCGILGLKLWKFVCTAITIIMLEMAAAETGAEPLLQAAVLIAVSVALMPLMQFRPQLYTYIFLAALMALLTRENYRRRAPLWLAVPMFALWANLHGGFVIGVVAFGLYTSVVAIEDLIGQCGFKRSARLSAVAVASAIATLANPYGLHAWSHVLGALNNPITRKEMVDWQPLLWALANSHGLHSGGFFFALVAAILAVLALVFLITARGGDLALVAIAAVMGAAAFNVVRNIPLAVIASVAPLARHLHLLGNKLRGAGENESVPSTLAAAPESVSTEPGSDAAAIAPTSATVAFSSAADAPGHLNRVGQAVIVAAALILTLGKGGLLSARIPAAMDYPAGAVAFMRSHQLHGNVLARFEWGQYLIFHLAPASRIFVDGRVDLVYPPNVIEEYLDFFGGEPGGARLLDRYPHDYVLMPTGSPADRTVSARTDWRLIYRDAVAVLFARANSPAAHLRGVPFSAAAPPSNFP